MWRPFLSFCPVKEVAEKITKKELCFPVGGGRPWLLGAVDLIYCLAERRKRGPALRRGLLGHPRVPSKASRPWERATLP